MVALKNPAQFGQRVVDRYFAEGWGSLSKRDLELLFFILLEKDGALDRSGSNYDIARLLRVTESKVVSLRKDAYARWRHFTSETHDDVVSRVFRVALSQAQLVQSMKYATARRMDEGFIPLLIEHPDDRAEVEHAIKGASGIPIFERNREVLLIHHETLVNVAESLGILERDPKKVQSQLKTLLGNQATLKSFLSMPIKKITWDDARAALNDAGTIVVEGGLHQTLPALMKIFIPSIK